MKRIFEIILLVTMGFAVYKYWQDAKHSNNKFDVSSTEFTTPLPSKGEPNKIIEMPKKSSYPKEDREVMEKIFAKFATGNFVGAIDLADGSTIDSTHSEKYYKWLQGQLPSILSSAGWTKLKMGDCDIATTYFLRAQAIISSEVSIKGLAICYYKLRNFIAAAEWFEKYMKLKPKDEQIKILYTDILESEGRYPEAVDILNEISASREEIGEVDNTSLHERLDSMRGREKENQHQAQEHSLHFNISFRAEDHEEIIAFVLNTLEEALSTYMDDYGFLPPLSPIDVILYPKEVFSDMVVGGPDWAVGLFDGRLRIPIDLKVIQGGRFSSLETVLRHELVHAMIALKNDHRSLPSWLEEGMAQRIACAKKGCTPYKFQATPGDFLQQISFNTPFTTYTSQKARRAYRQSLYLIYSLENLYGVDVLAKLTNQISKSRSLTSDDMLIPFGTTFEELHKKTEQFWINRELLKSVH